MAVLVAGVNELSHVISDRSIQLPSYVARLRVWKCEQRNAELRGMRNASRNLATSRGRDVGKGGRTAVKRGSA